MHHYLFIHSLVIRIGVNSSLAWETDSTGNSVFKCSICFLFSGLPRQLAPSALVTRLAAQKKKNPVRCLQIYVRYFKKSRKTLQQSSSCSCVLYFVKAIAILLLHNYSHANKAYVVVVVVVINHKCIKTEDYIIRLYNL